MQSHFVYPLQLDSLFLPGGDFPLSVTILHMCPCIEHRYVLLLGTSLFAHWHSSPPSLCNCKALLFFFKLFKIFEKVQKKSKNQNVGQGKMLSLAAIESCRLRTEHCISHPLVGLIVWLYVLYSFLWVYLHRLVKIPVPTEPLSMPPMS